MSVSNLQAGNWSQIKSKIVDAKNWNMFSKRGMPFLCLKTCEYKMEKNRPSLFCSGTIGLNGPFWELCKQSPYRVLPQVCFRNLSRLHFSFVDAISLMRYHVLT